MILLSFDAFWKRDLCNLKTPTAARDPKNNYASIGALFEKAVARFPNRVALTCNGEQYRYKEIGDSVDRISRVLLARLGSGKEPVAILCQHNVSVLTALLAALSAGRAYLALEPGPPSSRSQTVVSESKIRLIIADAPNVGHAEILAARSSDECQVLSLDLIESMPAPGVPKPEVDPGELAAIYYTSGSTGKPIGVQWTHSGLLQRFRTDTEDYRIGPDDNIALLFLCSFGASSSNIFNALLNGASLCLYDFMSGNLRDFCEWIQRESITIMHMPAMFYRQWLESLDPTDRFPTLRQVTPSGNKIYRWDVQRLWTHVPGSCLLLYRYGSSETGMCTRNQIYRDTSIPDAVVGVGKPAPGKVVRLLDDKGRELGLGEMGEIVVSSRYLSAGYLGDPELTRNRFRPDPDDPMGRVYHTGDLGRWGADGQLYWIGRSDFMVKIRGYRVEPSELEAVLYEFGHCRQATVMSDTGASGEAILVAYVVLVEGVHPDDIHQSLRSAVPRYLLPAAIVPLDRLPLTANGKVDRTRLPKPGFVDRGRKRSAAPPTTDTEKRISMIWSEILGGGPYGAGDDFFQMGGQSLAAMQVITRLNSIYGLDMTVLECFEQSTLGELAAHVDQLTRGAGSG